MQPLLSAASRSGLVVALFLLVSGVLRWDPVSARPPWDVRALPLLGPVVALAVAAGVAGRRASRVRLRPLLLALAAASAGLVLVVVARGPCGLAASAVDAQGRRFVLERGAVDLIGDDLARLTRSRRWKVGWEGDLRVPSSGIHRFWVDARGEVTVSVDGREVLRAEGDPARAGADVPLGRGVHRLDVRFERAGPGPRLRLGWVRPEGDGRPGTRSETLPPRHLGPEAPSWLWVATDLLALLVAALVAAVAWVVPWDVSRRPPPPRPLGRGELVASIAGHGLLVAVMSWPLVLDLAGASVLQRPDGRLNTWILGWNAHALIEAPGRIFQAPIFHPLPDTLAFTENLLLPAAVALPAIRLGGPVLGYNLILLGSAVVSGLGAQLLVRRVSGARLAAFVGGAAFAVGAHRWFRMAHLHAEVTLFLPFALLALDRFWERRSLGRALLLGLVVALQGLSSVYLGAITAVTAAVASGLALLAGLARREAAKLAAGFLLAGVLLAPVALPYLRMRAFQGVEFTLAHQALYATNLASYAASPSRLYGPVLARHMDPFATRDALFPGLVLLVLGLAGLAAAPRRYRAVAVVASAAALVLSLGPETGIYRLLHEHVVLLRGIRALSRFSLVPVLALSVLAGLALGRRFWASLAALALLLVEAFQGPFHFQRVTPPSEAARWLAGRPGAVVDLPIGPARDTHVMLQGLAHLRPLVNGDSGFIPRPYDRTLELLDAGPNEEALRYLRAAGVTHVVSREDHPLPLRERFGEERIYDVPGGDEARAPAPGRPVAVLWGAEGPRLDLGRVDRVARVAFELSDGPWLARPLVSASTDGVRWTEIVGRASLADAVLALTRDPRRGLGEIRFEPVGARFLRVDSRVPARAVHWWVGP